MSLLHLNEVTYSWDGDTLLDQVTLNLDAGEHIGLVGRNGCGKSTLLKLLAGDISPDQGAMNRAQDLHIKLLVQEVPTGAAQTVHDLVAGVLDIPEEEHWRRDKAVQRVLAQMQLDGGRKGFAAQVYALSDCNSKAETDAMLWRSWDWAV